MNGTRPALLLVACTLFSIMGCASHPVKVTGTRRPPIPPEQVVLYFNIPADFEIIATLIASSGARLTEERSVEYAIKELKKQAAKLGANGLMLEPKIETASSVDNSNHRYTTKTVQGTAIFVKAK
jgi:hypothetical protein